MRTAPTGPSRHSFLISTPSRARATPVPAHAPVRACPYMRRVRERNDPRSAGTQSVA